MPIEDGGDPHRLSRIERDLSTLTGRMDTAATALAVKDEREKNVGEKLDTLLEKVKDLENNNTWLFRLVIGAIIAAVLKFVLDGGLQHVT